MFERIIVIGDVHGCVKTLKNLITKIQPTSDDWIIMLGDYFDRGPSSAEVFKYLQEMNNKYSCTFLKGNHEQMLVNAFWKGERYLWYCNGGRITEDSFSKADIPIGQAISWASKLPLWIESEKYYFVHAGLPYGDPDQNDEEDMLWDRAHMQDEERMTSKTVVFGHTPHAKPILTPNGNICIDTGCVFNTENFKGSLTAMIINAKDEEDCEFISVPYIDFN